MILLEKRAGRVISEGKKKTPDPAKGMLCFWMEGEALHMGWRKLNESEMQIDVPLFDGEATFRLLENVKGRIVLAEMDRSDSCERFFFWLQDKEKDGDEDFVAIVSEFISESFKPMEAARTGPPQTLDDVDMAGILQHVMRSQQHVTVTDLADVLHPEKIAPIAARFTEEEASSLAEFLPFPDVSLEVEVMSGQFQQAVQQFSAALTRPGAAHSIFIQLGLDPSQISSLDGVKEFLLAVQRASDAKKSSS